VVPEDPASPEDPRAADDELGLATAQQALTATTSQIPLPDTPPDDGGGGGGPVSPPPISFIFKSSVGVGGAGAIRDLKFEKGSSSSQVPLGGYHLISADLNRGAGGAYIYLTFTRDAAVVQGGNECGHSTGEFVTGIHADDYNAVDAVGKKGNCSNLGPPWTPIWEETGILGWKHPDLNDGAGGRFIFAWLHKVDGLAPIKEIGVVSSRNGSVTCPSGWTRQNQDLNDGAGGDYIYFCFKT
jgi:hypothetical protein